MGGRWRTCGDERVCEACAEADGSHTTTTTPPPHGGCTNPDGCRCYLISDEDIAAGVNHLLRVEVLEESGDPSIIATPRIVPASHARIHGDLGADELARDAEPLLMGSGFLGGPIEPMVPPALWRVLLEYGRQHIKRLRWRLSENWDHARRIAAAKEVDRRRDANRD